MPAIKINQRNEKKILLASYSYPNIVDLTQWLTI